jgi:hypothetical protein
MDKAQQNINGATMRLERATKGALLYKNVKEGAGEALTTVYLRKEGMTEPYPITLTIVITTE